MLLYKRNAVSDIQTQTLLKILNFKSLVILFLYLPILLSVAAALAVKGILKVRNAAAPSAPQLPTSLDTAFCNFQSKEETL